MMITTEPISREHELLLEAIWKKQQDEVTYWIREFFGPLESKNVSIHEVELGGGMFNTITFDPDDKVVIVIRTDTTAATVEDSHEYMMLESPVVLKLADLIKRNQNPL